MDNKRGLRWNGEPEPPKSAPRPTAPASALGRALGWLVLGSLTVLLVSGVGALVVAMWRAVL